LIEGWRSTDTPIMCSYKVVHAAFEVWGLQTKVEDFIQRSIRDILLLGHRQAFAWIDEWYGMTMDDVRQYEKQKQTETNLKLNPQAPDSTSTFEKDHEVLIVNENEDQNENNHQEDKNLDVSTS